MPSLRSLPAAALVAAVSLLSSAGPAAAQGPGLAEIRPFVKESPPLGIRTTIRVRGLMEAKTRITGPEEKDNLAALDELAHHFVYKVTQERYYAPSPDTGELRARTGDDTLDSVFRELDQYLVRPTADTVGKMTIDHADYLKAFGAALDRAINDVLKSKPPAIIRTNAARMLAFVASSGAVAHAKTVTALLKDPATPPEVLIYTYKAAEGLLGAYDPTVVGKITASQHTVPVQELVALVSALEAHVIPGPPVADKVDGGPTAPGGTVPAVGGGARLESQSLTPQQVAVVQYYRRAAVRALAKVRFDILGGRNAIPEIRPVVTLARVAVNDAAVVPPATPAEQAEAVIGLCSVNIGAVMNVDELCHAIGTGVVAFARPRNSPATERMLPWKVYAERLGAALATFRASTAGSKSPRAARSAAQINGLAQLIQSEIIARLLSTTGGVAAGPNVERVVEWLVQNPPKDANRQLFEDAPKSKLNPRPPGG